MGRRSVHIEHKAYDPQGAAGQLRKALSGREGQELTVADVAAISGVPVFNVEPGLLALASEFPSRLRVTDHGELLFTFDSLTKTRAEGAVSQVVVRLGRRIRRLFAPVVVFLTLVLSCPLLMTLGGNHFALMAAIGNALAFPFFLSGFFMASGGFVWGTVMILMLMPAVFAVMGIVLLILSAVEPDKGRWAIGLIFGVPMLIFGGRYALKQLKDLPAVLHSSEKGTIAFWRQVGGFIFGPMPRLPDPLEDERRLTGLIRAREGVLVRGDLMALFGWDERTADSELTRILVHYGGDVGVSDSGHLLYRFESLMKTTEGAPAATYEDLAPAWKREVEAPVFFDCPRAVWAWFLFLLVAGFLGLLVHPDLTPFPDGEDYVQLAGVELFENFSAVLLEGLGGYLYAFCLGVPLLRLPFWLLARGRFARRRRELQAIEADVSGRHDEAAAAVHARERAGWREVCGDVAFDTAPAEA